MGIEGVGDWAGKEKVLIEVSTSLHGAFVVLQVTNEHKTLETAQNIQFKTFSIFCCNFSTFASISTALRQQILFRSNPVEKKVA